MENIKGSNPFWVVKILFGSTVHYHGDVVSSKANI